ncbi:MAG: AI-2E family transporter [Verrucomicrobiaceae bacterium]
MHKIPTAFERQTLWTAITILSITVIGALVVGFIWLVTRVIAFLQPILIPFAVAGVLAYLLEPVVSRLVKWGLGRQRAVLVVFVLVTAGVVGTSVIVVPALLNQGAELLDKMPQYSRDARAKMEAVATQWNEKLKKRHGVDLLHWSQPESPAQSSALPSSAPTQKVTATDTAPVSNEPTDLVTLQNLLSGEWLGTTLPNAGRSLWNVVSTSVGGFLGAFGFLLSLVIVPLYLYYFLTESTKIAETWSHYIPLRESQFRDEVVGTLTEINGYLIAFFRGQLVVSIINGVATGVGLVAVGLNFGWLIGLALCVLGIVPYLGIVICWIPAAIIASVQGGSYLIPAGSPWYVFPLIITGIFAVWQWIDGMFITPKIVGQSVGLHPMTVIVSVFAWSLILGGLLGAILAVPMTASLKVLFQRYIWERGVQRRLEGLQDADEPGGV